ncbi:innexin shaking-B-like [Apis dorsata]|uniref:innexin shaking-B-like n=1 Tax=Apis dorsata TaxID=7462 RepID=UPI001293EBF1|nr:innexin shaking-B-like [Apis dorsata]
MFVLNYNCSSMKYVSTVNSSAKIIINGEVIFSPNKILENRVLIEYNDVTIRTIRSKNEVKMIDKVMALCYSLHMNKTKTDSITIRLHFLTTILILMFSAIISSKQVVGNPIECVHTRDIPVEAFNSYCWIHSTYFVTRAMLGINGIDIVAPGVAPSYGNHYDQGDDIFSNKKTIKNVKYYQWVAFVLILQESENGK